MLALSLLSWPMSFFPPKSVFLNRREKSKTQTQKLSHPIANLPSKTSNVKWIFISSLGEVLLGCVWWVALQNSAASLPSLASPTPTPRSTAETTAASQPGEEPELFRPHSTAFTSISNQKLFFSGKCMMRMKSSHSYLSKAVCCGEMAPGVVDKGANACVRHRVPGTRLWLFIAVLQKECLGFIIFIFSYHSTKYALFCKFLASCVPMYSRDFFSFSFSYCLVYVFLICCYFFRLVYKVLGPSSIFVYTFHHSSFSLAPFTAPILVFILAPCFSQSVSSSLSISGKVN